MPWCLLCPNVAGPELWLKRFLPITALFYGRIVATASKLEGEKTRAPQILLKRQKLGLAWGIDAVRSLVPYGSIAVVLGESGGKSTLLNALWDAGRETGRIRESDKADVIQRLLVA